MKTLRFAGWLLGGTLLPGASSLPKNIGDYALLLQQNNIMPPVLQKTGTTLSLIKELPEGEVKAPFPVLLDSPHLIHGAERLEVGGRHGRPHRPG
jgi:hypothetical protein